MVCDILERAKTNSQSAQDRQYFYADRVRRAVSYEPGQHVTFNTKKYWYRHPGVNKLMPRYIGSFEVEAMIGKAAIKLSLPSSYMMHDVFHESLVKPFQVTPIGLGADSGAWFQSPDWTVKKYQTTALTEISKKYGQVG